MANISDFELELSGNPFELRAAYEEFHKDPYEYNIREIHQETMNTDTYTWSLTASGRWSVAMEPLIHLIEEYGLTGFICDAEPGSNYFCKYEFLDGINTYSVDTEYMSDEHYKHLPDPQFWIDSYCYALEEPENYPEVIEFFKRNGIDYE